MHIAIEMLVIFHVLMRDSKEKEEKEQDLQKHCLVGMHEFAIIILQN